jgi:hypothetical protein
VHFQAIIQVMSLPGLLLYNQCIHAVHRFGAVVDALESNCRDFSCSSALHGCLAIAHSLFVLGAITPPLPLQAPPLILELPACALVDKVLLLPITHATIDRAAAIRWLKPGAKQLADLAALRLHQAKCAEDAKREACADAVAARSIAVKARALAVKKTELLKQAVQACEQQRLKIQSADSAAADAEKLATAAEELARKKPTPTNTQKAETATKSAAAARSVHRTEVRALKPLDEKVASYIKAESEALSVAQKAETVAAGQEAAADSAAALEAQAIADAQKAADDRGPSWTWYDDNGRHFKFATKAASPNCSVSYGALNDRQRYCFIQILHSLLQ